MISTLVLLRHAKSAYPDDVADHDRPLNARGRRDAPAAGSLIAGIVAHFDLALISTAERAQQTWQLARPALLVGEQADAPELYLASADAMLSRIRDTDASALLVVAHNPGTEILAARLAANTASDPYQRMMTKFPTAAFAVLQAEVPFGQWGYGDSELTHFEVGRG